MEEDLKTIKLELDYYDKDGVHSIKLTSIKVNKPKDISTGSYNWSKKKYKLSFSIVLPDHVHPFIIGKPIPSRSLFDRDSLRTYDKGFSKTISSESLDTLCERYWEVLQDYKWLKNVDKAELQKVIFYEFDTISGAYKSTWDSTYFGNKNKLNYLYSIGYISGVGKSVTRYNSDKQEINNMRDKEFYTHKYVLWSEERQTFFDNIQKSFEGIIAKITVFENNLTEDSIDDLISDNQKLLS